MEQEKIDDRSANLENRLSLAFRKARESGLLGARLSLLLTCMNAGYAGISALNGNELSAGKLCKYNLTLGLYC